jgi:KaiC/GvpD/RAD55 family RecA-like ATPase
MTTTNELVAKQLEILGHEEGKEFTELRWDGFTKSGFFKSVAEVQLAASKIDKDAYIGINPRLRVDGHANSVGRLTCLVVDIDPIRGKDTASTDEQHQGAIGIGRRIIEDFSGGVLVSSGSGCHVYFPLVPIQVVDHNALGASLKKWCDEVKKLYGTKEYKVDSIWDLPRVIRLWGSYNTRSNRRCEPISGLDTKRFQWSFSQEAAKPEPKVFSSYAEERFLNLCKVNAKLKGLVDGTTALPSPSEYDFAFISTLAKAHFSVDEIKSLFHYNAHGNKSPKKGDVERVVGKVLEESQSSAFSLVHNSGSYFDGLKDRKMGARTGFEKLDSMLSGLKDGKMYIFAARPNQGKTTLCMQILTTLAEDGMPCLMFPTEVGAEPLIDKIISRKTGINLTKFQNGTFTEKDVALIKDCRDYVSSLPLSIIEEFGIGVDGILAYIDKYAPKVVCLDYFQALKWNDPNSVGEKESAVHKLKKVIKDRNIIGLVMSQLKRVENGGKAALSELKGTGALEELGDVVGQMYRIDSIGKYPVDVDLTITKSKYSQTGNIQLQFFSSQCNFKENQNEQSNQKQVGQGPTQR